MHKVLSYRGAIPTKGELVKVFGNAEGNDPVEFYERSQRYVAACGIVVSAIPGEYLVVASAAGEQNGRVPRGYGADLKITVNGAPRLVGWEE